MNKISKDPSNSGLLWTRTDARDAATACRLALEAEDPPTGPYNVTGSCIALPQTTSELVKQVFGDRTEIRVALPDHASPMSCDRAETTFGYQPRFPWSVTRRHTEDEIKP